MILFKLAYKSLLNRRASVLLTLLTIAISVMLLLSIERVRIDAKSSFSNHHQHKQLRERQPRHKMFLRFVINRPTINCNKETPKCSRNRRTGMCSSVSSQEGSKRGKFLVSLLAPTVLTSGT